MGCSYRSNQRNNKQNLRRMDTAVWLAALPTRNSFLVLRLSLIPSPSMPYLNIPPVHAKRGVNALFHLYLPANYCRSHAESHAVQTVALAQ